MKLLQLRKLHRWVALVVGLQVLVWTASGLMFAWLDQARVAGEGLAEPPVSTALPAAADLLEPARLPLADGTPVVRALELREVDGRWVYRIETDAGVRLLRASDGTPVAIDAAAARRLATSHYRGQGRLRTVKLHATETLATREARSDLGGGVRRCHWHAPLFFERRRVAGGRAHGCLAPQGPVLDAAHDGLPGPRRLQQSTRHGRGHGGRVGRAHRALAARARHASAPRGGRATDPLELEDLLELFLDLVFERLLDGVLGHRLEQLRDVRAHLRFGQRARDT